MRPPHSDIIAVIFDMDGLLFDTERLAVTGWQQAGREFGLTITEELVLRTVGRNTEDTRKILEQALISNYMPFLKVIEQNITRLKALVKEGDSK